MQRSNRKGTGFTHLEMGPHQALVVNAITATVMDIIFYRVTPNDEEELDKSRGVRDFASWRICFPN